MGTNIPIVLPVRNLALGSCPEAVSTAVLGPSWALWAALHRKFLGVQRLKPYKIHREQSLAGQICSDTQRNHCEELLLIPAASSHPQELLPCHQHHSTSQTPVEQCLCCLKTKDKIGAIKYKRSWEWDKNLPTVRKGESEQGKSHEES